jgi:hypothetical protein
VADRPAVTKLSAGEAGVRVVRPRRRNEGRGTSRQNLAMETYERAARLGLAPFGKMTTTRTTGEKRAIRNASHRLGLHATAKGWPRF